MNPEAESANNEGSNATIQAETAIKKTNNEPNAEGSNATRKQAETAINN
jgi:hypothetical protein